jgi:hypothetical protein
LCRFASGFAFSYALVAALVDEMANVQVLPERFGTWRTMSGDLESALYDVDCQLSTSWR